MLRRGLRFFNKEHLATQGIRTLSGICVGSETGFHLGDMSSCGPPKGVYQSLSSYVQQCAGNILNFPKCFHEEVFIAVYYSEMKII